LPRALLYIIYGLMVAVGLVAMYCLLNAGSPHSLLRLLWPDPTVDIYVAAGSSVMVFILGFLIVLLYGAGFIRDKLIPCFDSIFQCQTFIKQDIR